VGWNITASDLYSVPVTILDLRSLCNPSEDTEYCQLFTIVFTLYNSVSQTFCV
jgi:hypothetical protein